MSDGIDVGLSRPVVEPSVLVRGIFKTLDSEVTSLSKTLKLVKNNGLSNFREVLRKATEGFKKTTRIPTLGTKTTSN